MGTWKRILKEEGRGVNAAERGRKMRMKRKSLALQFRRRVLGPRRCRPLGCEE